ncbi:MAG: acyclic terpene utilization AtuA family protein [Verrucomicrobiae bacterium]|nr:acyclic terpene utilization AtuA family protein [Verrucomicrobiae bacterium]
MDEIRILSPTAILGYGFPRESFLRGMKASPHVIAVDAGSSDPGPFYLGHGKSFVDRNAVKRDLEIMITQGKKHGIPVIIGTAGGSGAKVHVDWCMEIIREIVRAHRLRLRTALVYSDVEKKTVIQNLQKKKIRPLPFAPSLTPKIVRNTTRVVAQIGVDPLIKALSKPVDLVVAGRCYDPAVFAALPVKEGFDLGLALHLGKILECAAIAASPGSGRDCVLGILKKNSFILQTLSPNRRFTVNSVAAHTLYEKSHPFILPGPGGHLDLSQCRFRQKTPNSVEVSGSQFVPDTPCTVKIEGAVCVGYRTISICGIRDRIMIRQLDDIFAAVREAVKNNFGVRDYRLNFRVYGRDGVMGPLEPAPQEIGHEAGVIIDVVAATQEEANTICGFTRSTALHYGYPGRIATAGNLAFPFSPSDTPMGAVYEFSIYHLMDIAGPSNLFPVKSMILN